ncbi:CvpA family protein [Pedosphaera parvula]|uniref:Colicin V production protein n=1 Tax=Pedosphaera parvula (strain Ellin514) TaxID=320771 RepID=B9XFW5_PEDPL|nr:CvpA family protein [Pedosphaera parvula]EEF61127.1 Colicin V production protein [Pedosphaera parvula Ellin514]
MNLLNLPINWFDIAVVIVVLLGINKGRKHGMSGEMMVMFQWMAIVAVGALFYKRLGDMLSDSCPFAHWTSYIAVYITIAIVVKCIFSVLKKGAGGKLVGSNMFGASEYYLGMIGGVIRFLCILMAGLALLNARFYSPQEIAQYDAFQRDVYGSTFFPDLSTVQQEVFKSSYLGKLVKTNAEFLLIKSTPPETKNLKRREDLP